MRGRGSARGARSTPSPRTTSAPAASGWPICITSRPQLRPGAGTKRASCARRGLSSLRRPCTQLSTRTRSRTSGGRRRGGRHPSGGPGACPTTGCHAGRSCACWMSTAALPPTPKWSALTRVAFSRTRSTATRSLAMRRAALTRLRGMGIAVAHVIEARHWWPASQWVPRP